MDFFYVLIIRYAAYHAVLYGRVCSKTSHLVGTDLKYAAVRSPTKVFSLGNIGSLHHGFWDVGAIAEGPFYVTSRASFIARAILHNFPVNGTLTRHCAN